MALVRPSIPDEAARILELARRDRVAAAERLTSRPVDEQVALVCETPVARRAELLGLLEAPEKVVPRLPEAELCFTVKAVGPEHAGWLVEHATRDQLVACVDLDAWSLQRFDPRRFQDWLAAAHAAGDDALERLARGVDAEVLVLALQDRVAVELKPSHEGEREGWEPPPGAQTLEGQFYYVPRREGDDLEEITALLRVLFERSYWDYFRFMQGAIHELPSDTEAWAEHWRRGRLEELGFPPRDEAVAIFARMEPEDRERLPEPTPTLDWVYEGWSLPVWVPPVPLERDAEHLLLAAAARLDEERRRAFLVRLLAVANKVAVAWDLPLSDVESVPLAMEEAVRTASRGLDTLARAHGEAPEALLSRVSLEHLFRVGASFSPEKAERALAANPDPEEPQDAGEASSDGTGEAGG
jgi:hypothetical protein